MSFRRFFLVRLGWALFGAWLAVMLVFLTFRVVSLPKEEFQGFREPAAAYRLYREEQHFQDPVYERYAGFIWGLVTEQSTGRSSTTGRDSGDIAREAVPVTASLVALALLFSLALATAAGIPWGRARSRGPRLANVPIYIAVGLTPIFLGLELSYYVGAKCGG